ncbi:hypothetical protein [Clostridium sp.]|uniref:hypothetical protein n=1 Tax=Clostridium sp. TaxID=1506 RepID=UPI003F66CA29
MKNRGNLRPVKVVQYGRVVLEGYFHCFGNSGNIQDGFYTTAIVEHGDGAITEFIADEIIFTDV